MSLKFEDVETSKEYILGAVNITAETAVILGSGLNAYADSLENKFYISYADIPNFSMTKVEGHPGRLVIGDVYNEKQVLIFQGRHHYYEGDMDKVIFPVRLSKALGIKKLVITNSSGGIGDNLNTGDFVLITDHINFMGTNPLIGEHDTRFGAKFIDMQNAYSKNLIELAKKEASALGITLKEGVFCGFTGPSYETYAEVKMAKLLGTHMCGMSTVPEVICAAQSELAVLGISIIANQICATLNKPLTHKEVVAAADNIKDNFRKLLNNIIMAI
jgi:purine-nucleoside phosphorylase